MRWGSGRTSGVQLLRGAGATVGMVSCLACSSPRGVGRPGAVPISAAATSPRSTTSLTSKTPLTSSTRARESIFEKTWTWEDENGGTTRLSAWRGRLLVVSLVYTTCTTVCPLAIEKMREVDARLTRAGQAAEYVLVTLDPSSDTPEQLRRFKAEHALPGRWHLLRGSPEQTEALAVFLRLKLMNLGDHVIHEARVVVLDGAGRLVGQMHG